MSDFSTIASSYQQRATLQRAASDRLFELLSIGKDDDILDLGCGPGHLTAKIRTLTTGRVTGIDPSPGMISEARRNYPIGIDFQVGLAESLDVSGRFDAIFTNSAFQWFRDPRGALEHCRAALRNGGRLAMQAPARTKYCPNFIQAVSAIDKDPKTRETFSRFRSPWFFLESAADYASLFESCGFTVVFSCIEEVHQRCEPEKAMAMFESGAAAGYLNQDHYAVPWPPGYAVAARTLIHDSLQAQAGADGQLELTFFRIYVLANKP